ncbi:MAG: Gldg family protein [Candidatus Eisenbacteria bacterium]|nr:Gldg family protein [Candidatus Eisenbacteria bacterium]
MARAARTLPLFLAGLLLLVLGVAWSTIEARAYLPRFVLLAGALILLWALVRNARELRMLFVQARAFSEPGPVTTLLLLALLLFLGALLSARMLTPVDLTAERLNSLSRASRTALAALPGPVRVQGFFADPSPQWDRAMRYFDLYRRSSPLVEAELIDPERDPAAARAAKVASGDRVVVSLNDARAEITELTEEELTQAILRVIEGRPRRVRFLQGHGEPSIAAGGDEGLSGWAEAMRGANIEAREVLLVENEDVPEGTDALVVVHPRHALFPQEAEAIRRYVEAGGRIGIWCEPGDTSGLEELLARSYLRFEAGTIRDQGRVTAGLGMGPWVIALVGDPNHPVTAGLNAFVTAPNAGPVAVVQPHPMDLTVVPFLKTTGAVETFADPGRERDLPLARGIAVVGAVAQWTIPVGRDWSSTPDAHGLPPIKPEARLLICGDASLVTNRFLGMGSNRDLALNAIHWLTNQERFLDIARERTRPAQLRAGAQGLRLLLYALEFGLPLAFAALGATVWMRRRAG